MSKPRGLRFQKMWETFGTPAFDIDTGSVITIIKRLKAVAGFADRHWLYYYDHGKASCYYERGEMAKAATAGLKAFLNRKFRERYFAEVGRILGEFEKLNKTIESSDIRKVPDDELRQLLRSNVYLLIEIFAYFLACQPQCVSSIETEIQSGLNEFADETVLNDVYTLLTTSSKLTKIKREEIDWLKLIILTRSKKTSPGDQQVRDLLKRHLEKYRMLNAADGHAPWTYGHFLKKFTIDSTQSLGSLKSKLKKMLSEPSRLKSTKEKTAKRFKISPKILAKCEVLAEIGHARLEMRVSGWIPGYYYNKFLLKEVARRFGCSLQEIIFARVEEVFDLWSGIKLNRRILKERSSYFLFLIFNGEALLYSGLKAKKKFKNLVRISDYSHLNEITGNVAMKGKVRGHVVVFHWGDNMKRKIKVMREDAILVAGQTRPQLMPMIVKSKAIVTDEGGITSHAAVVSRELRIPCVIGTHIATEVLHDGDLVEVDANKGIVKILKRA